MKKKKKRFKISYKWNRYGIRIKKCCASCRYKEYNENGTRICTKKQMTVKTLFKCRSWKMSEALNKVGSPPNA